MGKLVLTRLQGALNAGVVLGYNGESALVRLHGESDQRKIRREALIWTGPSCPESTEGIDAWVDTQFQEMFDGSKRISVAELWERAWGVSKGGVIDIQFLNSLLYRHPRQQRRDSGYASLMRVKPLAEVRTQENDPALCRRNRLCFDSLRRKLFFQQDFQRFPVRRGDLPDTNALRN